jgi:hypothetical protein
LTAGGNLVVAQAPPETKWPLSAVPQLQSNPGAARTIYLNFANEGVNATLGGRAYTIDQDRNTFTDTELADINFVWKGVAEKYSGRFGDSGRFWGHEPILTFWVF